MLYHKTFDVENQEPTISQARTQDPLLLQLRDIFLQNIDNIQSPNTVYSTLRKFRYLNIPISPEAVEKIGKKALDLCQFPYYKFNDYGSSISLLVKVLRQEALKTEETMKGLINIICTNGSKINLFYLVSCFPGFCEDNYLTGSQINNYFNLFKERKELLTFEQLSKIMKGVMSLFAKNENFLLKENNEISKKFLNSLEEILETFQTKKKLSRIYYTSFLDISIKLEKLKTRIPKKNIHQYERIMSILDRIWSENSHLLKDINFEDFRFIRILFESVKMLSDCQGQQIKYFTPEIKKDFIQSLFVLLDIRFSEIWKNEEALKTVCSYLLSEIDYIKENNVNRGLRYTTYHQMKEYYGEAKVLFHNLGKQLEEERNVLAKEYYKKRLSLEAVNEEKIQLHLLEYSCN